MECFVCEQAAGRQDVPGGIIHRTEHWLVDHCFGPLGVGTLILKPKRHVVHVADLDPSESAEVGPLLTRASAVVTELIQPDQVYVCLWSHEGGDPTHLHFVVQPVTREQTRTVRGPRLQAAMFDASVQPPLDEVEQFAERARTVFKRM
jgi:diadenosine tetraphosphate (Ap4A) HIT family hydrolase